MKKINLLILGYSKFVQNRILNSLKKSNKFNIEICSKSKNNNIIKYNDYNLALKSKPDLVYISLTNHLHYKYAKLALNRNLNVIVDKPITVTLKEVKELIKIAKKKKVLLAEATLFNFHRVFEKILKILNGKKNLNYIHSNFNVPIVKSLKRINLTKSDCFMDMSPYAAAIIRIYFGSNIGKISSHKEYFVNSKCIKSFYVFANNNKLKYFGNFGIDKEYLSQIIFFSKKKIVYLDSQAFALPYNKNIKLNVKENNKYKILNVKMDNSINNFFNLVLRSIKTKKYSKMYKFVEEDAKIRDIIKNNKF